MLNFSIQLAERVKRWTVKWSFPLVVFSTLLIAVATLTPGHKLWESKIWSFDKLGHTGLFFGWTWNVLSLFQKRKMDRLPYLNGIIACFLFSGGIEFLQWLLPIMRAAELLDLAADMLGGCIAIAIFHLLTKEQSVRVYK